MLLLYATRWRCRRVNVKWVCLHAAVRTQLTSPPCSRLTTTQEVHLKFWGKSGMLHAEVLQLVSCGSCLLRVSSVLIVLYFLYFQGLCLPYIAIWTSVILYWRKQMIFRHAVRDRSLLLNMFKWQLRTYLLDSVSRILSAATATFLLHHLVCRCFTTFLLTYLLTYLSYI